MRPTEASKALIISVCFVFLYLVTGFSQDVIAADGDLDPSFGNNGLVTVNVNVNSFDGGYAAALQPDGKILVVGETSDNTFISDFLVARLNGDGTLDSTFGSNGIVTTSFSASSHDVARDIVLQPDGKFVVAGDTESAGTLDFALARYNSDGTLDSSFGTNGLVTTDFSGSILDFGNSIALQPDGKMIVAGFCCSSFALARYNPDGTLDSSFGNNGIVTTDFPSGSTDSAQAIIIQPDGKILIGGQHYNGSNYDFALARYNPDGTLDSNFGSGGLVTTTFPGNGSDVIFEMALLNDGRIVSAGYIASGGNLNFGIARYNPDGTPDINFGSGGFITTDFPGNGQDIISAIAFQMDGKIIAAGETNSTVNSDLALARYLPDGMLDSTFGNGGLVTTNLPANHSDYLYDMFLLPDGKIVGAGRTYNGANTDLVVARYFGASSCLFCDDFEDSILDANWDYAKPMWNETGAALVGIPEGKKALAVASPVFQGCTLCSVQTVMSTAGGPFNKLFFYGWYLDKKNAVVVLMKQEAGKFVLKQISNGVTVAKAKLEVPINPNQFYDVTVTFDGVNFVMNVDANPPVIMSAITAPDNGTVAFAVKNTTGSFDLITVQ